MDARARYLLAHYGLTVGEYAEMAIFQGGACKCCGQTPTGRDLHVDHDHKVAKEKVKCKQLTEHTWVANVRFSKVFEGASRAEVTKLAKQWLLRKSVRGLLCWKCNEGLRAFKNKSAVLRNAANYLDEFAATLV